MLLFGVIRFFAKPPPHTMNREWQEAANERLRVRIHKWKNATVVSHADVSIVTATKLRPRHWCLVGRLQRHGTDPVPPEELSLKACLTATISFVKQTRATHGAFSVCKNVLEHGLVGLEHSSTDGLV